MTVIVGILCSDGVVIGSDSAMAAGRLHTGYTIERQEGDVLKLEVIERNIITAGTGAMGLSQRFNERVGATIKELRAPFLPAANLCIIQYRPGGHLPCKCLLNFAAYEAKARYQSAR
jgi:hypothetical protein